jgi:peroxin-11B
MLTIGRERATVSTQFLSDVCDITIPASALGYGAGYLDDGIVGLAGTVGSLLGLASQWAKTA